MKCKERYDSESMNGFKHWLRRIHGFRESVIARNKKKNKSREFSRGNESSNRDKREEG